MTARHTLTPGNEKAASSRHGQRNASAPTAPQSTHVDFSQPSFLQTLSASPAGRPSITPNQAAYLQRAAGNHAVAQLLQRSGTTRLPELQRHSDHEPVERASSAAGGQLSPALQSEIQRAQAGGHAL